VQPLAAKLGGLLQPFTLNNVTGDLRVQKNRCGRAQLRANSAPQPHFLVGRGLAALSPRTSPPLSILRASDDATPLIPLAVFGKSHTGFNITHVGIMAP